MREKCERISLASGGVRDGKGKKRWVAQKRMTVEQIGMRDTVEKTMRKEGQKVRQYWLGREQYKFILVDLGDKRSEG